MMQCFYDQQYFKLLTVVHLILTTTLRSSTAPCHFTGQETADEKFGHLSKVAEWASSKTRSSGVPPTALLLITQPRHSFSIPPIDLGAPKKAEILSQKIPKRYWKKVPTRYVSTPTSVKALFRTEKSWNHSPSQALQS